MPSTYDHRYPTVYPVSYTLPGLTVWEQKEARRVGEAVASRTGTRAFYNSVSGKLLWVYGPEPAGGPLGVSFRIPGGIRHYEGHDIDNMVLYIGHGRMKRSHKERIAKENEKSESLEREKADAVRLHDRRHDIESYAAHVSRRRRGVPTVISA